VYEENQLDNPAFTVDYAWQTLSKKQQLNIKKSLKLNSPNQKFLHLEGDNIDDKGVYNIVDGLSKNSYIEYINFENNHITSKGISLIYKSF
jgi:hypothetical protein